MLRLSNVRGGVLRRAGAAVGALGLGAGLLGGIGILAATPASAIPLPPSTSSCTYNGSPTAVVASNTAGTSVTVSCTGLPKKTLLIVAADQSPGRGDKPVNILGTEADLATGTSVTTSATGTLTATITVTATGGTPSFSATDKNAVCPPTQAQVNAGLTNCVVTVADLATTTGLNYGIHLCHPAIAPRANAGPHTRPHRSEGRGGHRPRQGWRLPDARHRNQQMLVGGGTHRDSQQSRRRSRLHRDHKRDPGH